jgi:hypothetical protein
VFANHGEIGILFMGGDNLKWCSQCVSFSRCKQCIHMYVNAKMIHVETVPEIKGKGWVRVVEGGIQV